MKNCSVVGCTRKYYAKGLCEFHRYRFILYGDPLKTKNAPYGGGHITRPYGSHKPYKKIFINGKLVSEHRIIMEKHLNRKLTKDEVVHHINGDTLDNSIENLQVFENNSQHQRERKGSHCWNCKYKLPKNATKWCLKYSFNRGHKCKQSY